ncbi:hypothetical protein [Modestobacter versicolor]|uniref:Uncharacterized protein n=1 Tax=Modestobacter versicolor TaxID=429133 RepID=A0A323VDL6_9ACTN|nr:hypothetical protein [Modestobacter versicolor]MBB3676309.1 hypothetical protein [Modestobacter versicolor]PZA22769.1 hypothetical protein DMO24_03390 [Modestobacter versicolor]
MRTTLVRVTLAGTALALSLGLAGCSGGSAAPSAQAQRNDAAQQLAEARQATLVPVAAQLELLQRAEQRAELAGTPVADVEAALATYRDLAAAIEAAPTAGAVRTLVDRSGVDLDGSPVTDLG